VYSISLNITQFLHGVNGQPYYSGFVFGSLPLTNVRD